ncbi:MAG: hypothetical protein NTY70_02960 [Burkholderiales bacterium]|nr:hypothetical protein [Burkholderiales bacterium]
MQFYVSLVRGGATWPATPSTQAARINLTMSATLLMLAGLFLRYTQSSLLFSAKQWVV